MALTDKEVLKSFEKTGGILQGHFLLTSGRHSDKYMQCAKLFMDASESEKLCRALADKLKAYNVDAVVSPAVGGILFGYETSRHLGCPNMFAERVDGKFALRRGFSLPEGAKVAVVEDVVTTGGSIKEVIDLIREMGCTVSVAASLVDRSNGQVKFDVPFVALLSMEVVSYEACDCPICKSGLPLVKPGSRALKV